MNAENFRVNRDMRGADRYVRIGLNRKKGK